MALQKKAQKGEKTDPVSFRFAKETDAQLKALAEYLGRSQIEIVESLIEHEFEAQRKKDAEGIETVFKKQLRLKAKS